jgi:EAL domain-containing protein (putative c-di-GMP-specific phosphodiesterase class I)
MGGKTMGPALPQTDDAKDSALVNQDQLAAMTIREAMAADAFRLNFQPTVSLDESEEQYFEVRCGLAFDSESLPARQLFDIANKQQLGGELDRWIITRVFRLLRLSNQPNLNLSVWIGRASIQDPQFIDWIDCQLCDSATVPRQVIIQINEQDVPPEENSAQQFFLSLKGMGFRICLVERTEELGRVATSRDLLQNHSQEVARVLPRNLARDVARNVPLDSPLNLPLDYLKLAPEYIHNIEHESKRRMRLKKRIAALNRRGISVIASQLDDILLLPILWRARVDFVQGNCLRAPDQNINTGIPHHQAICLN